jgi:hypothetical protein
MNTVDPRVKTVKELVYLFEKPSRKHLFLKPITVVFILFQLLDLVLTKLGLHLFNGLGELNPLVSMFGWNIVILFKFIVCLDIAYLMQVSKPIRRINLVWKIVTILSVLIVAWNVWNIVLALFV